MRVVSLTCSNTEIVCALGCADQLVGVDSHSDHPPEVVERLPRVGRDLGIDVERVAELEPDLVLASLTVPGHEQVVENVKKAGLPHLAPEPERLVDVYRDVRTIAEHLGVPERGGELVARMRRAIESQPPHSGKTGPGVLVEWWPKPVIVPGRQSWVTDLLAWAGAHNPWGDERVKSRPVTDEEVKERSPDAVIISWCGVDPSKYRPEQVYRRSAWRDLPALAECEVHCVPEAYLGRPGPRLVEGYYALREIVSRFARTW